MLELASNAGVETILNPSSPERLSSDVHSQFSHLVMNESETAILSGRAPNDVQDWDVTEKSAEAFADLGVSHVVITLGERGAYYTSRNGESRHVPAVKGMMKDTIGVGYI